LVLVNTYATDGYLQKISTNSSDNGIQNSNAAAVRPSVPFNISFIPQKRLVLRDNGTITNFTITLSVGVHVNSSDTVRLCLDLEATEIEAVVYGLPTGDKCLNSTSDDGSIVEMLQLTGARLGRYNLAATVQIVTADGINETALDTGGYQVIVIRSALTKIAIVSLFGVSICTCVNIFSYGCQLTPKAVRERLRRPAGFIIGSVCQFIFMPVLTYLAGLAFSLPSALRYALLALGCSPGGGPSNFATLILRGDLDLSVMMTFTSNLLSIGMMPLWLCTLGQSILREHYPDWTVHPPWRQLCLFGLCLSLPTVLGCLIRWRLPRVARVLSVVVRASAALGMIVFFATAVYANVWVFNYMSNWRPIVATVLICHISYLFSYALTRLVCQQSHAITLTIAIEAGVQSMPTMLVVLQLTCPIPEAHVGFSVAVVYILNVLGTLLVCIVAMVVYNAVQKVRAKRRGATEAEEGGHGSTSKDDEMTMEEVLGESTNEGEVTSAVTAGSAAYDKRPMEIQGVEDCGRRSEKSTVTADSDVAKNTTEEMTKLPVINGISVSLEKY
jgi:sodium/bile acid cotransporter 4